MMRFEKIYPAKKVGELVRLKSDLLWSRNADSFLQWPAGSLFLNSMGIWPQPQGDLKMVAVMIPASLIAPPEFSKSAEFARLQMGPEHQVRKKKKQSSTAGKIDPKTFGFDVGHIAFSERAGMFDLAGLKFHFSEENKLEMTEFVLADGSRWKAFVERADHGAAILTAEGTAGGQRVRIQAVMVFNRYVLDGNIKEQPPRIFACRLFDGLRMIQMRRVLPAAGKESAG